MRWCASRPDLGFDDVAYALPPLHLHEHTVQTEMPLNGMLFAAEAQTLSERRDARRMSIEDRVRECAAIVNADSSRGSSGAISTPKVMHSRKQAP